MSNVINTHLDFESFLSPFLFFFFLLESSLESWYDNSDSDSSSSINESSSSYILYTRCMSLLHTLSLAST